MMNNKTNNKESATQSKEQNKDQRGLGRCNHSNSEESTHKGQKGSDCSCENKRIEK